MDSIVNNPYRIAGILSNASEREVQKQKARIKAYSSVGKSVITDYDFNFIEGVNRDDDKIQRAFANVEQNADKVKHSLFWFLNLNPFDNTAIGYLKNGDKEKAMEIWEKVTQGKEINAKNFSSFNNIGTCHLMSRIKTDVKKGIEQKIKLIQSDYFKNFVHAVADKTYSVDADKHIKIFVNDMIAELDGQYSSIDISQIFKGCNLSIRKYSTNKLTEGPVHKIEAAIETTKAKRKKNTAMAFQYGLNLYTDCQMDLASLKSLMTSNDLKYRMIADNLANEVMQCGIDYFQARKENSDPSEKGLQLLQYAKSIAVGDQTCDRISENLAGIREWAKTAPVKDDLNYVTNRLKVFQRLDDSIIHAKNLVIDCKPKLRHIKSILGATDELYLNVSGAVVNHALGMVIDIVNEAQSGIEYDRAKLRRLPNIVTSSVAVVRYIGGLDMDNQTRKRYSDNKATIERIDNQLQSINRQSNYRSPSQGTASSLDDGCAPWVYIVGGIILLIILANTCS